MVTKVIENKNAIFSFKKIKRINVKNANKFKIRVLRAIVNPSIDNIIIDLTNLDFMDTYAANVLVTLRKFGWKKNKRFYLRNISSDFQEIINLLNLERDFRTLEKGELP